MRDLYILGSSGHAREMAQLVRQINSVAPRWRFMGYVAQADEEVGRTLSYGQVVGTDGWLMQQTFEADAVIGIGYPGVRREVAGRFAHCRNLAWPNLIHPGAQVEPDAVMMGRGNVVTRNCVLTCDIEMADFNHLNWAVTVGHDARLGSFNVINPGANISGGVTLHDQILIGTGAQVLEGIEIASCSIIGAGAVVTSSIDVEGGTHVGVPAACRK